MEQRCEKILEAIIKEHIKTALPVGSTILVDKYKLGVSSATVRNIMMELEDQGLIMQPHTSAGRIPTEKAYRIWTSNIASSKNIPKFESEIAEATLEQDLKGLAREVASNTGQAVFLAIHRRNFYHTGISNLLTQPEFVQTNLIYNISTMIDRMELIIEEQFDTFAPGIQLLIGEENPFSPLCSSFVLKYQLNGYVGVVGIVGPLRMNYEYNLAVIKLIDEKIKKYERQEKK